MLFEKENRGRVQKEKGRGYTTEDGESKKERPPGTKPKEKGGTSGE